VSRCSSVSIVTELQTGRLEYDYWLGKGFLLFTSRPDRLWSPPSLLSNG